MVHLNSATTPFVLIVAIIDVFFVVLWLGLVLPRISAVRNGRFCHCCQELVDPVVQYVDKRLYRHRQRSSPRWVPWTIVLVGCLIARQMIVTIAICLS